MIYAGLFLAGVISGVLGYYIYDLIETYILERWYEEFDWCFLEDLDDYIDLDLDK